MHLFLLCKESPKMDGNKNSYILKLVYVNRREVDKTS
jgi:hypothetical protein